MTTTTAPSPAATAGRRTYVTDTWVIARRGLVHMRRQPEKLADATIQPIMFVLLFAYVFGGAIAVPGGGSYKEFLMGGIFAQTLVFTSFGVALALSEDRQNNAIDRFHSLPIARSAVLAGHAFASLLKSFLPIVLMSATGLIVGWRIHSSVPEAAAGFALMVCFSFAMIWIGVVLGSVVATPEGVQGVAFTTLFPLTFLASTFVPTSTIPDGLRQIAEWNPTTTLANSIRHLFGNPGGHIPHEGSWPITHPILYTLLWIVAIVVVCAPLSVRVYQRAIRD